MTPDRSRPSFTWHDGDTSLLFGLFACIVFALLVARIANPDNWIAIADVPPAIICNPTTTPD